MQVVIQKDYERMSAATAERILDTIRKKPDATLCLAAGDTPRRAYELLSKAVNEGKADIRRCTFVALDEWVGIAPDNEGSCQYFLNTTLIRPMKIAGEQCHMFNALSENLDEECLLMDRFIREHGGIDLMVVGIGRNGHIGFNEPGIGTYLYAHVVPLDNTTVSVGQKYFRQETKLTQGITLGLKHLLESREAILIANGEKKAEVIRAAVEGPIDPSMPASIIRKHPNATVILDSEAAALLPNSYR